MTHLTDILWGKASPSLFITKEAFVQNLAGWDIKPVMVDGVLAFITVQKGPDFHFQSLGTGHRITLRMIRDFLEPIIREHGFAATRTPKGDTRQRRFNERFGFKQVGEDVFDIHYRIEELPMSGDAKCQSSQ